MTINRDAAELTIDTPLEDIFPILRLTEEQRQARFIEVLDRGLTSSRLKVDLPDTVYGEWHHNDPGSIARMEALGFVVDKWYATRNALHTDGRGNAIVGDVIHMICPISIRQEMDRARAIKYRINNNIETPIEDRQAEVLSEFGHPHHIMPLPVKNQLNIIPGSAIGNS